MVDARRPPVALVGGLRHRQAQRPEGLVRRQRRPIRSTAHASVCIICTMAYRAGVLGGSGYAGAELLRLLAGHPEIEVVHVTADSNVGAAVGELYPGLLGAYEQPALLADRGGDLTGLDLALLRAAARREPVVAARSARPRGPRDRPRRRLPPARPTCTRAGTARRTTRPRSPTASRTGSSSSTATRSRRTRTSRRRVATRPRSASRARRSLALGLVEPRIIADAVSGRLGRGPRR